MQNNAGSIDLELGVLETVIEELLLHPNIRLYSFPSNFQLVCDLNNYRDPWHYGEWVNSWMLKQMYEGNYLLTENNYQEHLAAMREFYNSYDYASLHGE